MIDMNCIIANNIRNTLKHSEKSPDVLAEHLGYSTQTVMDMLSGVRTINGSELSRIAQFCGVPLKKLTVLPEKPVETNVVYMFMERIKTDEARKGLAIADQLIDMYLFHSRACKMTTATMLEKSNL